jgi:hypothetical protein
MNRKTKITIASIIALLVGLYFAYTSVNKYINSYDLLERNNTILRANQEFYKAQVESIQKEKDGLVVKIDSFQSNIDSLKGLKNVIIIDRNKGRDFIIGLSNEQMQNYYDNKAKQLQRK